MAMANTHIPAARLTSLQVSEKADGVRRYISTSC